MGDVIRLVRDPEANPSQHLDVVQNFRLWLEHMDREDREDVLANLKLPGGDSIMDELREWAGLLRRLGIE